LVGCTGRSTWTYSNGDLCVHDVIVSPLAGLGGGISWRPPAYTACYDCLLFGVLQISQPCIKMYTFCLKFRKFPREGHSSLHITVFAASRYSAAHSVTLLFPFRPLCVGDIRLPKRNFPALAVGSSPWSERTGERTVTKMLRSRSPFVAWQLSSCGHANRCSVLNRLLPPKKTHQYVLTVRPRYCSLTPA